MQILNGFLTLLFAVHGGVFLYMYIRNNKLRHLMLVGTFALLTPAFAMLAFRYRPPVDLLVLTLDVPTILRILALVFTIAAIFLFLTDRKKSTAREKAPGHGEKNQA